MRISDWSSDVCSSDLNHAGRAELADLVAGQRLPVALVLGRHVAADRGDTEAEQTRCFRGRDDLVVQCRGDVLGDAMKRLPARIRSEEHTSELQSLMRSSYAVFCLKKKKDTHTANR